MYLSMRAISSFISFLKIHNKQPNIGSSAQAQKQHQNTLITSSVHNSSQYSPPAILLQVKNYSNNLQQNQQPLIQLSMSQNLNVVIQQKLKQNKLKMLQSKQKYCNQKNGTELQIFEDQSSNLIKIKSNLTIFKQSEVIRMQKQRQFQNTQKMYDASPQQTVNEQNLNQQQFEMLKCTDEIQLESVRQQTLQKQHNTPIDSSRIRLPHGFCQRTQQYSLNTKQNCNFMSNARQCIQNNTTYQSILCKSQPKMKHQPICVEINPNQQMKVVDDIELLEWLEQ